MTMTDDDVDDGDQLEQYALAHVIRQRFAWPHGQRVALWRIDEPMSSNDRPLYELRRTWPEALQLAASHDGGAQATTFEVAGWYSYGGIWALMWRCHRCNADPAIGTDPLVICPAKHDQWHYDRDAADDLAARRERFGI